MAMSVNQGFELFLSRLVPTQAEVQAAASHRASVEAKLKANFGISRFWQSGSFSHGTGVRYRSDVDYFASMPLPRPSSSTTALNSVKQALVERFPGTSIYVDRPAVVVAFGGGAETYEVIPAYLADADDGSDKLAYQIAGSGGSWIKAAPDSHLSYVNDCNKKPSLGKAKGMARILKAWKYYRSVPVSSFYLEMRAAKYVAGESQIFWLMDLKYLLRELRDGGLASMNDPTGASGRFDACKTSVQKEESLSKLDTAISRANNAYEADRAGKTWEAFYYLGLLFNGEFPSYG
ncbi:hypothetical protein O7626_24155 [Micromonospora sp. WMMD1102]|uniref:SMODS domain-containing nucleotidyltransferase n=1 Tax=Micromonospora sp. WMMD1102 TaxID=3016105 RepID=UPI00241535FC|nr:hypothetical protein [Micromonospora sp. WMMD1102]MDG4788985.1 hypothetical protein [Micromonospora sp. WMMD1102]